MRKKNQPGCKCCVGGPYTVTFTVNGCGFLPLPGAAVTVKQGTTTVAGGTTNSSGQFVTSLAAGSYTWTVTKSRFNNATGSFTLTAAHAVTVNMVRTTGYACCGCPDPIATTLYLTTGLGTTTLTNIAGCDWTGTRTVAVSSWLTTLTNSCTPTLGVNNVTIQYLLRAPSTAGGQWILQAEAQAQVVSGILHWYADASYFYCILPPLTEPEALYTPGPATFVNMGGCGLPLALSGTIPSTDWTNGIGDSLPPLDSGTAATTE